MRRLVFALLFLNLVFAIYSTATLSREQFRYMGLTPIYSVVMAFALVLLAYWVWQDGKRLERI